MVPYMALKIVDAITFRMATSMVQKSPASSIFKMTTSMVQANNYLG